MSKKKDLKFEALSTEDMGAISITTNVLEAIATKVASEVPGVVTSNTSLQKELGAFLGITGDKIKAQASRLELGPIEMDVEIRVIYGYSVPEVALEVQQKIKEYILDMTDVPVAEVNVHVLSVETEVSKEDKTENDGE